MKYRTANSRVNIDYIDFKLFERLCIFHLFDPFYMLLMFTEPRYFFQKIRYRVIFQAKFSTSRERAESLTELKINFKITLPP